MTSTKQARMLQKLHNTFIPHEGNNHQPHALRPHALRWYAGIMVGIKMVTTMLLFVVYPDFAHLSSDIRNDSFVYLNEARTNAGLPELQINVELDRAAQSKALDILERGYFAHEDPDGHMPWDLVNTEIYNYHNVGENLAIDFTTGKVAHQALMQSEGHRNNILGDTFTDIGIGVVSGNFNGRNTNILVQLYGSQHQTPKTTLIPVAQAAQNEPVTAQQTETPLIETPPQEKTPPQENTPETTVEQPPVETEATTTETTGEQKTPPVKIVYKNQHVDSTALAATIKRPVTKPITDEPPTETTTGLLSKTAEKQTASKLDTMLAVAKWSKRILYAFLAYLALTLLLNIAIKIRIQHMPTIGGALLVMLVIGSLTVLHVHSLEQAARVVSIF